MKKVKLLFYLSLIFSVLLSVGLIVYFSLSYSFITNIDTITFIIVIASIVIYSLLAFLLIRYYRFYRSTIERIKDNEVRFGIDSLFNDKSSFIQQIGKKYESKKHDKALISFSVFSQTEKHQYFQLVKISKFYSLIVRYFELLEKQKEYKNRLFAGFDNEKFIIFYVYDEIKEIDFLINKIERDLYSVYSEADINVNMHPIFGIYRIDGSVNKIQNMMENSYLALNAANNNFQTVVYYDLSLSGESSHNEVLQKEIERGIQNHEFKVYYQGKFDLNTNQFAGAEALIRWEHPEKGLFNPSVFIGECEKSGLIHVLDFYVFDQVCKDLGDWKKRGRRMIPVSTNFSSYDFYRPDFVESVMKAIEDNNINPLYVELEVTESSTANNYFYVMSVLKRLQNMDIKILMDDFGTGFSSLGNLKKYPINALKIDKSFIDDITEDIKSREIVQTIIQLSKSLGLQSIAEGVQTEKQLKVLRQLKCDQIQGFYYCKPMTKKEFEIFLSTNEFEKRGKLL